MILCGHSRGGIVISSAAERAPESIRALVYITAFMLPSGQSLRAFQMDAPNPPFASALSLRPTGLRSCSIAQPLQRCSITAP